MTIGNVTVSKKLTTAVVTGLVVALNSYFDLGLGKPEVTQIVGLAVAYIVGQSYVDARNK